MTNATFWVLSIFPLAFYLLFRTNHLLKVNKQLQAEFARKTQQMEESKNSISLEMENLERQNKMKDKLLSFISHELRNPLFYLENLSNNIQLLLDQEQYQQIEKLNSDVSQATANLGELMDKVLHWSIIQSEHLPQDPQIQNLSAIIKIVERSNAHALLQKRIRIKQLFPSSLQLVADRVSLVIIFQNLITNAIKFTPEDGEIWIVAILEDHRIKITIQDNGIGMSADQVQNLFRTPVNRSIPGTLGEPGNGLGLSIVNEIIRLNKGELFIESAVGIGTTVTLMLPVKPASLATAKPLSVA